MPCSTIKSIKMIKAHKSYIGQKIHTKYTCFRIFSFSIVMQSTKTKAPRLKATYVGRPVIYILHVDCCWDNCGATSECIHEYERLWAGQKCYMLQKHRQKQIRLIALQNWPKSTVQVEIIARVKFSILPKIWV